MPDVSPAEIHRHLDAIAHPNSLGRVGVVADRLCEVQSTLAPGVVPRRLVVFAGGAVPTAEIRHLLSGGAAGAVLAKQANTDLVVVDVGSAAEAMPEGPHYRSRKVRLPGQRSPATADQFRAAFVVGQREAEQAAADGIKLVAAGVLGGTTAEGVAGVLSGLAPEADVLAALASVAGVEVAAAAGFLARATERGLVVVGTPGSAATRISGRLCPAVVGKLIDAGDESPFGALSVFPLLDAAAAMLAQATPLPESRPPAGPKAPRKVAVFTGSFDPPTTFHRRVARLIRGKGFDEVIVRPTGPRQEPPDGEHAIPIHRAVMADLAFRDLPGVTVDLSDLDEGTFLDDFRFDDQYGGRGEVWHVVSADFLTGGRSGQSIVQTRWPHGKELWQSGRFVVLHPSNAPPDPADLPPVHALVPTDNHVLTAEIRLRVFQGGQPAPDVPEGVDAYIRRYRLFTGVPSPRETRITLDDPRLMIVADDHNARGRELAARFRHLESSDPTAILVLGGDGSMLSAIRKHWRRRLPFLGLNAGTLGFLMNEELPTDLVRAELVVYRMPMLRVDTTAPDGRTARALAFADAWVERDSGQAAWLRVDVDGRTQVPKVVGDGFLVATPAGSGAYARAMGATPVPLTAPVLTLAGSNVFRPRFWKPLALPENAVVRITSLDTLGKRPVRAFLDGHPIGPVRQMEVRVSSAAAVELAFTPQFDLSARLLRSLFPPLEEW